MIMKATQHAAWTVPCELTDDISGIVPRRRHLIKV